MMAICRPHTEIIVSELNKPRTSEEMRKIRMQLEQNERILEDFGDQGTLFPKRGRSAYSWNDSELHFLHLPGCRILGHSIRSAQRGRHPIFGAVDDPEKDMRETERTPELRKEFFEWLTGAYMPMFRRGGAITVFGTIWDVNAVVGMMLSGVDLVLSEDGEFETHDSRWDDWRKKIFALVEADAKGNLFSNFPDDITVEGFEQKKKSIGLHKAMAEYQGKPMRGGELAFPRDPFQHGFMVCHETDLDQPVGLKKLFLDLKTGKTTPYEEFADELYVAGACDLADSTSTYADYGAIVIVGASPERTYYVLGAMIVKAHADLLVKKAFAMAAEFKAHRLGFEVGSFQNYVYRDTMRLRKELEDGGMHAPMVIPIKNVRVGKTERILGTLRPVFRNEEIRFPHFGKITTPDEKTYTPAQDPYMKHLTVLLEQVDMFTDEGASGKDDGIDALQMAIRILGRRKGMVAKKLSPNDEEYAEWEKMGISWPAQSIPPEAWPEKIRKEQARKRHAWMTGQGLPEHVVDPYQQEGY
jgi:hypothetical protein